MTTLVLSPFFYPEPISTGKYNTVLAEGLVSRGENVIVFSSHPIYPKWIPERSNADLPGVTIARGGGWIRYPRSAMLRRIILEVWFTSYTFIKFFAVRNKVDRVVPIFPPSLFFLVISFFVKKSSDSIGIVHDLQGVHAKISGSVLGRVPVKAIHWIESRCFARCDRLIFLSQAMAERAITEYSLSRDKCVVCYPFVAMPTQSSEPKAALINILKSGYINVVYSGALGDKQSPDDLFEFMNQLGQRKEDLRCHIFSAGPHFERLKNKFESSGNCFVTFHYLVPSANLLELYERSSIQIIPQSDGSGDGSLPSKLPNLLAEGVPIFAICEATSEMGYLVTRADAGLVAESWEANSLNATFDRLLLKLLSESREARRTRLKDFVIDNFSIKKVADEILGVRNIVVGSSYIKSDIN